MRAAGSRRWGSSRVYSMKPVTFPMIIVPRRQRLQRRDAENAEEAQRKREVDRPRKAMACPTDEIDRPRKAMACPTEEIDRPRKAMACPTGAGVEVWCACQATATCWRVMPSTRLNSRGKTLTNLGSIFSQFSSTHLPRGLPVASAWLEIIP